MRILKQLSMNMSVLALVACSPVKIPAVNQYQLTEYSTKQLSSHSRPIALWVTVPEAVAGYQTEQMLYVNKPFKLEGFVKNTWSNPPGDMIYPLMVQSLQKTGFFHAVVSSAYSLGANYRLDTQVLSLKQNFLKKPSVLEFSAKIVLTDIANNKVIASRLINQQIPCSMDTPYGGVIAANKATRQFTAVMSDFVVSHLK